MPGPGPLDLLIVGGGINGAAIARDAAGRGFSVLLCEKGDLAEGTSSRSSNLIHGGLRYLEHYEFGLVREALAEREVLLRAAPHLVRPMRFVLPLAPFGHPAWLLRIGLLLYDHLGGRRHLVGTRRLELARAPEGAPIRSGYRTAFEYSDCATDGARLVVANALDAAQNGADIRVRTRMSTAREDGGLWRVSLGREDGGEEEIAARILINAAGPWVEEALGLIEGAQARARARLVKGSHIIVRKFWAGEHAYLLQGEDRRVVFVLPYEPDFALIGTTDVPFAGKVEDVAVEEAEREYLLAAVGRYLRNAPARSEILAEYAGVRALYDDKAKNPAAVTREYVLDLEVETGRAPLLNVFGGKLTTHRSLAEHALRKLAPYLASPRKTWTRAAPLPGGNIPGADCPRFARELVERFDALPRALVQHYARLYGTRAESLLEGVKTTADLGRHFGGRLYEREADFLIETEWARTAADILTRRTRHFLYLDRTEQEAFASWLAGRH